jgi:hypothetical protein
VDVANNRALHEWFFLQTRTGGGREARVT